MCKNNRDGELPSCLAAKYDGPGCEEWDLCYQCADTLKAEKDKLVLQNDELRKHIERIGGEVPAHLKALEKLDETGPLGEAAEALRKTFRITEKRECLHGGVFRGEKCGTCGEKVL